MQALSKIVYIATADVEAGWEEEYNRWYDEEHIPGLTSVPGYFSARRYVAVEGAPKYMAFYEIESMDAYRSPAHDRAANTPWTERLKSHRTSRLDFYEQLAPENGVLPGAAWDGGQGVSNGLHVVRMDVAPENDEEMAEWYSQEHLPALCTVPGVVCARVFRAIQGGPKYMAVYHLTEPSVQASANWQKAAFTPWTLRMRRLVPDRWRVVYQPK